jgi:putative endonuclease
MGRNNIVGSWGEFLAAEYLRKHKYSIVATNYRCKFGEIDLIVSNKQYLVFVEVKLRKSDKFASAFEHVDYHKQNKIRTTAEIFLSQYVTDLQPRFDVIEIYAPDGIETKHPVINHMEDAFE